MAINTNPAAPGVKTSEFLVTLSGGVGIAALTLGLVDNLSQADQLTQLIVSATAGFTSILTIGWIVVEYIKGRRNIKSLLIEKGVITQVEQPVVNIPEPVIQVPVTDTPPVIETPPANPDQVFG